MRYIGSYTGSGPGSRQLAFTWQQAVFYPNQYLTFDQDGRYTKHYYAGMQRIASRLGESTHGISCGYGDFPAAVRDFLEQRSMHLQEIFNSQLSELITLEPGRALPVDMETFGISSLETTAGDPAGDIYYYSVNHLGSTAFQHIIHQYIIKREV